MSKDSLQEPTILTSHERYFFKDLFVTLIAQGYFKKFNSYQEINFLDIGYNQRSIYLFLEELQKLLYEMKGINSSFKLLSLDFNPHRFDNLKKIPNKNKYFFGAIDPSNPASLHESMQMANMSRADIVLIKSPEAIGLERAQDLSFIIPGLISINEFLDFLHRPHVMFVDGPFFLANPVPRILDSLFSLTLSSFRIEKMLSLFKVEDFFAYKNYVQFHDILCGPIAQEFEGAMVLTTSQSSFELLAAQAVIHKAYWGKINSGIFASRHSGMNHYDLIENYRYETVTSWGKFVNFIDSEMCLAILGFYALYRLRKTGFISITTIELFSISNTLIFLPTLLLLFLGCIPRVGAIEWSPPILEDKNTIYEYGAMLCALAWGVKKISVWIGKFAKNTKDFFRHEKQDRTLPQMSWGFNFFPKLDKLPTPDNPRNFQVARPH